MEIAVFLNSNGETISFNETGVVKVYLKDKEEWKVIKEIVFGIDNLTTSKEIREKLTAMAQALGECKVFVATEIKGLPFTVLDGMGFNIWKVKGTPEKFLEHVLESEEEEKLNKLKGQVIPTPVQQGDKGNYYIDLKAIMESNEKVTSKQMLLPFLNNESFNELEIVCGHIPPWFEGEFKKLNLKSHIEKINEGEFNVKVHPEDCSNCRLD